MPKIEKINLNKKIVFIIAPSLGVNGQARVAALLQSALLEEFEPIVVGYKSKLTPMSDYEGQIIELPWGTDIKAIRRLLYPFRLLVLAYMTIKWKPMIIIGQGFGGGMLAYFSSLFVLHKRTILSIHESKTAQSHQKRVFSLTEYLAKKCTYTHFVSHGLKQEFKEITKNQIVITTPSSKSC